MIKERKPRFMSGQFEPTTCVAHDDLLFLFRICRQKQPLAAKIYGTRLSLDLPLISYPKLKALYGTEIDNFI